MLEIQCYDLGGNPHTCMSLKLHINLHITNQCDDGPRAKHKEWHIRWEVFAYLIIIVGESYEALLSASDGMNVFLLWVVFFGSSKFLTLQSKDHSTKKVTIHIAHDTWINRENTNDDISFQIILLVDLFPKATFRMSHSWLWKNGIHECSYRCKMH